MIMPAKYILRLQLTKAAGRSNVMGLFHSVLSVVLIVFVDGGRVYFRFCGFSALLFLVLRKRSRCSD